ncbi:alpha/beta fold hydrolase [Georgenia alba]|uniref:Alpha/beta fold hydrolase n=1 Tax=Georgenia alba TaxID=2233858 RepID=A0ABW2Q864_9MICO
MTTTFPEIHPASTAPSDARDNLPVVLLHGGNVASWMWQDQLPALAQRTVVTPDLPGYGSRTAETWPGIGGAADDVVARVAELTGHRRFHLAGLSLGGVVALHLTARHPGVVVSVLASGAPLLPYRGLMWLVSRMQVALWDAEWFWRTQAVAYRLPHETRELYVRHGLSVRRETVRRQLADVDLGTVPQGLGAYDGPVLLVAGERDAAVIRRSLQSAASVAPQATTRLAPGMHHAWNTEDPELFDAMLLAWLDGRVEPRLLPA